MEHVLVLEMFQNRALERDRPYQRKKNWCLKCFNVDQTLKLISTNKPCFDAKSFYDEGVSLGRTGREGIYLR